MRKPTKKEIESFRKDVCQNCSSQPHCDCADKTCEMCPKMFNYLCGFKDGKWHYTPEIVERMRQIKRE